MMVAREERERLLRFLPCLALLGEKEEGIRRIRNGSRMGDRISQQSERERKEGRKGGEHKNKKKWKGKEGWW
jgi:hypothetical protein